MNNIPKELFVNITDKGRNFGFVCVEHKRFVPCRPCLYNIVTIIPYSESTEDIQMVRDWHMS